MSKPDFGMRDMSEPAFWFSVRFGEELSSGALIVMNTRSFTKAIKDADVYDLNSLKNRPCQIDVEGNTVNFVKILSKNA